jgi:hypothetical protein
MPRRSAANESFVFNHRRNEKHRIFGTAEFGLLARRSYGLSVITNEGSTTKKLIAEMRLLGQIVPAIFGRFMRDYNGVRHGIEKTAETALGSIKTRWTQLVCSIQKSFSLDTPTARSINA